MVAGILELEAGLWLENVWEVGGEPESVIQIDHECADVIEMDHDLGPSLPPI